MKRLTITAVCAVVFGASGVSAAEVTVAIKAIAEEGIGPIIGTVAFQDTSKGLKIWPNLRGLVQGRHGFHVHENADCGAMEKDGKLVLGLAAGGHFDPGKTVKHRGPKGMGHLGDLPALHVDDKGRATRTSFAPRLKTSNLLGGRTIVIHAGGDSYQDQPIPLGGGGARIACGVVVH
jgi:Cu-Zn family superoxide dismutase